MSSVRKGNICGPKETEASKAFLNSILVVENPLLPKKQMKLNNQNIVSIKIKNDIYFQMLKICLDRKITVENFIITAMKEYLKKHKG